MMRKLKYFKRHRMELPLPEPLAEVPLPPGYRWMPWDDSLLALHAEVKFLSFQHHDDAIIFPALGSRAGCHELMHAIRHRDNFCPEATWLVVGPEGGVGTIQGLIDSNGFGGIQNLGVIPECRGLGIGKALLVKALAGFARRGVPRAFLEVTASNEPAVRMYRAMGFRAYKTFYRSVELPTESVVVG